MESLLVAGVGSWADALAVWGGAVWGGLARPRVLTGRAGRMRANRVVFTEAVSGVAHWGRTAGTLV
ncbi:MAG TPA: hypothetical protein VGD71_36870, partial [Kribbella sp.]